MSKFDIIQYINKCECQVKLNDILVSCSPIQRQDLLNQIESDASEGIDAATACIYYLEDILYEGVRTSLDGISYEMDGDVLVLGISKTDLMNI